MNNCDFEIGSGVLDVINEYADEIIDLIYDKIPFLMVFAVVNQERKTEYKTFYCHPSELGIILNEDKFKKIFDLFDIPRSGYPSVKKDFGLSAKEKKELNLQIAKLAYFCKNNNIPCFFEFAISNDSSGETPSTKYLMEMISPFCLMQNLYDDRITKILRYTLNPDDYPDNGFEIDENDILSSIDESYME